MTRRRKRAGWIRLLRRLGIDVRPQEATLVGGLFVASFVLGVFQFSSKAVRQAGFIDSFGADRLPLVYLTVALVAYPLLRLYGSVADRWSQVAVISTTVSVICTGLLFFWWQMAGDAPGWVAAGFYVWVAIATALVLTQLWSLTNTFLDARQARRLFGFIGAGSLLGGVVGGQVASLTRDEPRHALLVAAAMLIALIWVVVRLDRLNDQGMTLTGAILRPGERLLRPRKEGKAQGLRVLKESPHLRLIAAILLITVVVAQVVDLQFSWVVENSRESLADRVAIFGHVFSLMGLAAFFFQILLTPRIHRSLGVGQAMRILPCFVAIGSVGVLAVAGFAPALLVVAVGALRVGDNGLRYSLDHVTRELLFVPVPAAQRVEAKGYVDVLIHRFGKALGAVLLLTVTVGWVTPIQATWFTLFLVGAWLSLTVRAKQHYVDALRRGLNDRNAFLESESSSDLDIDPNDVNTLEILVESLGSADEARVVGSLELLRNHGRSRLVPPLLLHHDHPDVRRMTLEIMVDAERRDAVPLIERCVGDDDPDVRAKAIGALARLSGQEGVELMQRRLDDSDPRVRSAAATCVMTQGDESQQARAEKVLVEMVSDADPATRVEAAKALGALPEPTLQQHVIGLLFDSEHRVARSMVVALRSRMARPGRTPIYVPILISLLRDRRLKHDTRDTLVAYGPSVLPALSHFLNDDNEQVWVRRAIPKTIAEFGGRGAAGVLYESLPHCEDSMQRAKIVEALCGLPVHECDRGRVTSALRDLVRRYFECVCALESLERDGPEGEAGAADALTMATRNRDARPPLVVELLREERQTHLRTLGMLLGLLVPDVEAEQLIMRAKGSAARRRRSQALEYLDNVLEGELRDDLLLAFDDLPQSQRVEDARQRFSIPAHDGESALGWLLDRAAGHEAERWLAAAAAYRVGERQVVALYPKVLALQHNEHSRLVRETAEYVASRMIA